MRRLSRRLLVVGILACALIYGGLGVWGECSSSQALENKHTKDTTAQYISLSHRSKTRSQVKQVTKVMVSLQVSQSLEDFAQVLLDNKVIHSKWLFVYYVKLFADFRLAKSGRYAFERGESARAIVAKITSGEVVKELQLSVTIPEGFTMKQVAERLEALKVGRFDEIWKLMNDSTWLVSLGIQGSTVEGYLYPETYQFFDTFPKVQEVLQRMVKQFFYELPKNHAQKLKQHSLSLHEAVIFASLIEKETSLDHERGKISEVIWNRLKAKMPLAIDAALIYGIKDYAGDITFAHLKDAGNPYNTRIHLGLPPSPIGAVSRASLVAVWNPTRFGYYYYVLRPGSGGEHSFSRSLKQHNRYVKRLLQSSR